MEEAETRYLAIKAWWASSNCTSDDGLRHLQLWLVFWHFRCLQWGGFMELVHLPYDSLLFFFPDFSFFFVLLLLLHFSNHEKVLTQDQLAEMSSCNLAESVHNKWLQASGNKGGDLYVATVNDYICAFLQVVAYYQFLKGGIGRDGPSKKELKLRGAQRRAQRTGDPTMLQKVLLDMPDGEEFCTRDPHLEGAEVFGS